VLPRAFGTIRGKERASIHVIGGGLCGSCILHSQGIRFLLHAFPDLSQDDQTASAVHRHGQQFLSYCALQQVLHLMSVR
jgi:hypothetical protein